MIMEKIKTRRSRSEFENLLYLKFTEKEKFPSDKISSQITVFFQ